MGGGGIGVYVKNTFKVKILTHSEPTYDNKPECLILELFFASTKILFAVVYRRPEATYPSVIFKILSEFLPIYKNVVITGDFNMNMNEKSEKSDNMATHLANRSLFLVPSEPTNHTL